MFPVRFALIALLGLACDEAAPPAPSAVAVAPKVEAPVVTAAPAAPPVAKKDNEKTVLDVAVGSPDHTTLVAAVKATDLVDALNSPGGIYTVFAPTNAAFDALPAGTLDKLLEPASKDTLKAIVRHHACVPIMKLSEFTDGQKISMSDGTAVTMHVKGDDVRVDDAKILGTVNAMNGVVYVVDKVLLPPA